MGEFLRIGGEWMYITTFMGVVAMVCALAHVAFARGRGAPGLVFASYGLVLGTGLLGVLTSLVITAKATELAVPAEVMPMTAAGIGASMHPLVLAAFLALPVAALHGVGALVAREGRERRLGERIAGGVAGLVAMLFLLSGVAGSWALARIASLASTGEPLPEAVASLLGSAGLSGGLATLLSFALAVFGFVVGVRRATRSRGEPEPPDFVPLNEAG